MTVTYTDPTHAEPHTSESDAYVPVYARKRRTGGGSGSGGVKAWMILAPLGVLTVAGVTAAMMMSGPAEDEAAPLVAEPVASTPAPLPAAPVTETSAQAVPAPVAATPAPVAAPVERRAAPVERRAAPVRRTAPAAVRAASADADDSGTAALNRAQAATPAPVVAPAPAAPAPRAPAIQAQPFPGQ